MLWKHWEWFDMNTEKRVFELPRTLEGHLATLSKIFANNGERQLQEILVNAKTRIVEEWSYDNWNGGIYGHALYFSIPEPLYLNAVGRKSEIETQIRNELDRIHNVQNEHVAAVFIEMDAMGDHDWRKDSGLLLSGNIMVPTDATKRIWEDEGFRLFLSHKSEVKVETSELKERLRPFGISCFVAHEDIEPTKAWQDEIENALATMDGFVALLTAGYHHSDWTDQEVGFAVARRVPIVAVRLGIDPYGFIGKYQGLRSDWKTASEDVLKILFKNDRMFSSYINALRNCQSYSHGNTLAVALPVIERLTTTQVDEIVAAYNETSELRGSFGFNGGYPKLYGAGLVPCLNRLDMRQYRYSKSGLIEQLE